MMRANQRRRGVILLDLILGTTLIVIAGVAFVTLLGQNFATVAQLRDREREISLAGEQLERMSALWSTADFEARRGQFRAGAFVATVTPVAANLFDVTMADTTFGIVVLRTTMYAVDTANAGR